MWRRGCLAAVPRPPLLLLPALLSCVVPVARALKGFGIVFSIEPLEGSYAGGTELHVAGAGFAYATQVLVGGASCEIFVPSVKDGELTCYTPPGTQEWADVEVVYTSGHRAKLRTARGFRYRSRSTPYVNSITYASPVLGNVTFLGDLKKVLEGNQRDMFEQLREKRNATEIMHAYIGTGEEVMSDKAGRGEFRCDMIETPDMGTGICEVKAGTSAGYYNFTYVLEDSGTGLGYGKARWDVYGFSKVSLAGDEYVLEVYPTMHSLSTHRTGRLGGTNVTLVADGLDAGKKNFSVRHAVLLDGVPCVVQHVARAGNQQVLTCTTGATEARLPSWPTPDSQPAPGHWGHKWREAQGLNLAPRRYDLPLSIPRSLSMLDNVELLYPLSRCGGSTASMRSHRRLEDCADLCFRIGSCKVFWHRPDTGDCRLCQTLDSTGAAPASTEGPGSGRRRRNVEWMPEVGGGVYKLLQSGKEYIRRATTGPTWALLDAYQRCDADMIYLNYYIAGQGLKGADLQTCADACATARLDADRGKCRYFGLFHEYYTGSKVRCVIYQPKTDTTAEPNYLPRCGPLERKTDSSWGGYSRYTLHELTKPTPHSPPPTGIYPGGRGVLYRVWNACPVGAAFHGTCNDMWFMPFAPLYATMNPQYAAQTPMFEGIRSDMLRSPFGYERQRFDSPHELLNIDPESPLKTLANASGDHGLVSEMMGFFVPPFSANYSFLVWGTGRQDVWLSTSRDPSDTVLVAESLAGVWCRSGSNPSTMLGCSVFRDNADQSHVRDRQLGVNLQYTWGFSGWRSTVRTPTVRTMSLKKGERRFLVRRSAFPEDTHNTPGRRRRRHWEGTALRIHKPDMSSLSPKARAALAGASSWPELIYFWRAIETDKEGGEFRFGIREALPGPVTWSRWIRAEFSEWDIQAAWNEMRLPSGTKCFSEAWYMSQSQHEDNVLGHYAALLIAWRPSGNILPLVVERRQMRVDLKVYTISDGDSNDLFLFPISGSLFEAPAKSPQAQLSAVGLPAAHAVQASSGSANATENATDDVGREYAGLYNGVMTPSVGPVLPCAPQSSSPAFRFYRLTILGLKGSSYAPAEAQFAELYMWGSTGALLDLSNASITASCASLSLPNLIDGDATTLASLTGGSGDAAVLLLDLGAGGERAVDMWSVVSSGTNDLDMERWVLVGSNDNSTWWTVSEQVDWDSEILSSGSGTHRGALPNDLGRSTCGRDTSGCQFGQAFRGTYNSGPTLDEPEVYPSWRECQRRCCYDSRCRAVAYDEATGICTKLATHFEPVFSVLSRTSLVGNVLARGPPADGYVAAERVVDAEGLPLAAYEGHRLVSFCKEQCNKKPGCRSFAWHEKHGCFLKTQCVEPGSQLSSDESNGFVTYYQWPRRGSCKEVWDFSLAEAQPLLEPGGPNSSLSGVEHDTGDGGHLYVELLGRTRMGFKKGMPPTTSTTTTSFEGSQGVWNMTGNASGFIGGPVRLLKQDQEDKELQEYFAMSPSACREGCRKVCSRAWRAHHHGSGPPLPGNASGNASMGTRPRKNASEIAGQIMEAFENHSQDSRPRNESWADLHNLVSGIIGGGLGPLWNETAGDDSEDEGNETSPPADFVDHVLDTYHHYAGLVNWSEGWNVTDLWNRTDLREQISRTVKKWTRSAKNESGNFSDEMLHYDECFDSCVDKMCVNMTNWTNVTEVTITVTTTPPPLRLAVADGSYVVEGSPVVPGTEGVTGRLEVLYLGQWGTVCDDSFDDAEAQVACRQLGYSFGASLGSAATASGSGPVWLDDMDCDGSEASLSACGHGGWGESNCFHNEDVGVQCMEATTTQTVTTTTPLTTTLFGVQLVERRLGFLRNALSGRCADVDDDQDGSYIKLQNCKYLSTGSNNQLWELTREGFIRSLSNGKCFDMHAENDYLELGECEDNASLPEHLEHRFVHTPDGFFRNQRSGLCIDVRGSPGTQTDSYLQVAACELDAAVTDQQWEFVERSSSSSMRGFLRNFDSRRCLDAKGTPATWNGAALVLYDCEYNVNGTDQAWELTYGGLLRSLLSGRCAEANQDGRLELAECDENSTTGLHQRWELNASGYLRNLRSGACVEATGSSNLDGIEVSACSVDKDQRWEFVDEDVAGLCVSLCRTDSRSDFWQLDEDLKCRCKAFPSDQRYYQRLSGNSGGGLRSRGNTIAGFLGPIVLPTGADRPGTVPSMLADRFLGLDSVAGSEGEAEDPFGFTYLSEDEQPFVSQLLINSEEVFNMSEGDNVTLRGGNFGGVAAGTIEISLGGVPCSGISVSDNELSFRAPLTMHARVNLRVLVGWKGWADFGPLVSRGSGRQHAQVAVLFGQGVNEVASADPAEGSVLGGTRLTISGRGFRLPSGLNNVTLLRTSGPAASTVAGLCEILRASLTSIECLVPALNRSTWLSTQPTETVSIDVNGVAATAQGAPVTYTYTLAKTPRVLRVQPQALSFAVTSTVTLIGYNFELLTRRVTVRFGERQCIVWDANETHVVCQLLRSGSARPDNRTVAPTLLVSGKGYAEVEPGGYLDTRFEIHNVTPSVGSEQGGAVVTLRGIGFGSPDVTSQLMVAALGTLGDVVSWSPTQVVFTTRAVTLNTDLVDMMVNLINAEHKCGVDMTVGPCKFAAFQVSFTPEVTYASPSSGRAGAHFTVGVMLPVGYGAGVTESSVAVKLGDHPCPHFPLTLAGDYVTITCQVPEFEASTVKVQVMVQPLGYAKFGMTQARQAVSENFINELAVDSITPSAGSSGVHRLVLRGGGFSTTPSRHFVRVGEDDYAFCEPVESGYSNLTCLLNWRGSYQGRATVEVALWDREVALDPLQAFGGSMTGCLKWGDDWSTDGCLSEAECAFRCLSKEDCVSFDYRPRYKNCKMSKTSFTKCSTCESQRLTDCRYMERRTEAQQTAAVTTRVSNGFTFSAATSSPTPSRGAHEEPLWNVSDELVLQAQRSTITDAIITAATANPAGGFVKASVDGVPCPVVALRDVPGRSSLIDIACRLGEVPGGLVQHALLEVPSLSLSLEYRDWLSLPLVVSSKAAVGSLGGGWNLEVAGLGFAPPKQAGANSFVEVSVCGRPCEVVGGNYTAVSCIMPNVSTPEVAAGSLPALALPAAQVVSRNAGLAKTMTPVCFHGVGDDFYEVGDPVCASVFDGDTELTGGLAGGGCHVGLDFGEHTDVRVEQIRYHPLYDAREAYQYVNSRFEVGVLKSNPACDELSYGWRGVSYRGCQTTAASGHACARWDSVGSLSDLVTKMPSLAGHQKCRNPDPYSMPEGIWCYTDRGKKEYCSRKVPDIEWTTIHTIKTKPRMLWNMATLSSATTARFVRFISPPGNCRFTELEVVGQLIAPAASCGVAVRNVRAAPGRGVRTDLGRPGWRAGLHVLSGFQETSSGWAAQAGANVSFSSSTTPQVDTIEPMNGTARGGTTVVIRGSGFGQAWEAANATNETAQVTVALNGYDCQVTEVSPTSVTCVTGARNAGIQPPSMKVRVGNVGLALVRPGVRWRYLDRWSELSTWANAEPPVDGDMVSVPSGQAVLLDQDTPRLMILTVEGVFVFDDTKDLHLQASYIWVKGGTFEIGTEDRPFLRRATITLYGNKYEAVRLPVIGAKCLAVSNTQFTIRELGDGATEEGDIGTLDIHGAPRLKVWTRLARTAEQGSRTIVLQDDVDFKPGEELLVTATETPHKHMNGNGLHGAPPVDFENERVFVESVASDMRTITLRSPLQHRHISTSYTRPDGEYIDLSAEVALLSRNVKIQGDETSELDNWGGHTMVAFGGVYRLENAEFYRMGQTGELSRYPVHFHISQEYGKQCYAKYNSIHHSFQRAVAIHSTNYVLVKGNVGFDIIGHMFFVETGMERFNTIEGNLGVGAIPLLSGMLESDQEPSGFWTAAMNNVWRDNVAVTGSDGWYFQLPKHPISHSMDVYSDSICPVGDRIGEWTRNRCHHTTGTCIRVYLTWKPTKDPCNSLSGENPQVLFNTTCWGVGNNCFNAMKGGSIHNHHMTAVEVGNSDIIHTLFNRGASYNGAKWPTDYQAIPHVQDSVFVGILPQNMANTSKMKWKSSTIEMPQDEHFFVADSTFVNYRHVPVFQDCSKCWSPGKWRQGAFTYRFKNLAFSNSSKRIYVYKKGIYWDLDGTLTGVADSYTTWADKHNLGVSGCTVTQGLVNVTPDESMEAPSGFLSSGGLDMTDSIFHIIQNPNALIHSRREYSFVTCTRPLRKFEIAYPEPQEVYLRQLNITNLDTGYTHIYEYEDKEVFGWTFPVLSNSRLEIRPNLAGLDMSEASIRYAFFDLLKFKEAQAIRNKQVLQPEWFQLTVASWSSWNHFRLTNPDWELVATRHGETAGFKAQQAAKRLPMSTSPPASPQQQPSMSHGMPDPQHWSVTFRFPLPANAPPPEQEPLSARFEARRCPDEGCTLGLPDINFNWTTYELWSEKFGRTVEGQAVEIRAEDWVVFDMDEPVSIANLTLYGKLSFSDARDRTLETGHIVVWGMLEVGTAAAPFGATTNATARIRLRGAVLNVQSYVYIEEETLHGKLIAVPGRLETHGAPIADTWLRLADNITGSDSMLCVLGSGSGSLDWAPGSEVVIAPTEFDRPASDVETHFLSERPWWNATHGCWQLNITGKLARTRSSGVVPVGPGRNVTLRPVIARVDRSVVFDSVSTDGSHNYGGHIEVFDLPSLTPMRVGHAKMKYTQFNNLGKGGLSAAIKIGYKTNFDPPPVNVFEGCSWTRTLDYGLHVVSSNAPLMVSKNVFTNCHNGGLFVQAPSSAVQILNNAVVGVSMSPKAPMSTNEFNGGQRVINYAGIRTDDLPVRMLGNVVAGSNDIGFMHRAEDCSLMRIFNNEASAVTIGVFLLPQKTGTCQTANLYTVWKAAHIAVFIADIIVGNTQLSHIVISDSHMGIVPYYSVGKAYRRLWVYDSVLIGSSPLSSCSASKFCRAQSTTDPYSSTCSSILAPASLRRIGYVAPFNTANKKTCDTSMDPRQCRLMSPAYVKLDECHFPFEFHDHFDRGLGWAFFERTTFAYWKVSDCGRTSRAISVGVSGAEINFPASFANTTWYESDAGAKFEMSSSVLDQTFVGRKSPCKESGGGCMGLDQMLLQDLDGTLLGASAGKGSVVPLTPRTEVVWSAMCSSELDGSSVDALVCPNVTVQLVEMRNLDRGAKDVKFGPWVLTPNVQEDNGFEGGVLSSVGPFYGSCPCGWDFSFYHVLVKPSVTYYAEVVSLPENFMLRYWSQRPTDSVLLQFFYPDSRGVNVFVGGASEPDMALRLARMPTLQDLHGAHVVDAQALRLYVTVRGSPEGFNSRTDLLIRRTPTVKLRMNVEISITEFNAVNFQTNLAILLGIPPERIKVVAVSATRRLSSTGQVIWQRVDDEDPSDAAGDATGRRLQSGTSSSLEVTIEPSSDAAAAGAGGDGQSQSASSLDAQSSELTQVASSLEVLQNSQSLAAAAGGTVSVQEVVAPAELDTSQAEEAVTAADTAQPANVDVVAAAQAQASADLSESAPCSTSFGAMATVGSTTGVVYLSAPLASGSEAYAACADVDAGYEGNVTLQCSTGVLSANAGACTARGCSAAIQVSVGGQSASVSPPTSMASGTTQDMACSGVNSGYSGTYQFACSFGALSADVATCMPGCLASSSVNVTVAGQTDSWSPASNMASGDKAYTPCEPINSAYSGQIEIICYFGILTPNPSQCSPKHCAVGSEVNVTLGGVTGVVTLAAQIQSGLTSTTDCSAVNPIYCSSLVLSCSMGVLSYNVQGCKLTCTAGQTITVSLGASGGRRLASAIVSPTGNLDDGATEYNRACSSLDPGFEGSWSLVCNNGVLTANTDGCTEKACDTTTSVSVTVGGATATVQPDITVASGGSLQTLCSAVNSLYTGLVTLTCTRGALSVGSTACVVTPCQPWHFVVGAVEGVSGLVYPRASIASGSLGVGECGNANIEYSGDVTMNCTLGQLRVTETSQCRLTCSSYGSSSAVTVDGGEYTVSPASRIRHGDTGAQVCSAAAYGYSGQIDLSCDNGTLSVQAVNCVPDLCPPTLQFTTSLGGVSGSSTPIVHIDSNASGVADCNAVNPSYTGNISVYCYAARLTVLSSAGCMLTCSLSSSVVVAIGGEDRIVTPASPVVHGGSGFQVCSAVAPGYSGQIMLGCIDGNTTVVSVDCTPDPCADPAASGENSTSNATVPHGHEWTVPCSTISDVLYGDIGMSCSAGQISSNSSSCAGPCGNDTAPAQGQLPPQVQNLLHGGFFLEQCSALNSQYDGVINVTCTLGNLDSDTSGCKLACLTSTTVAIVIKATPVNAQLTQRIAHDASETQSCGVLGDYDGNFTLSCNEGLVSAVHSCKVKCPVSMSVPLTIGGQSFNIHPSAMLGHSKNETQTCQSTYPGYDGNIEIMCNDGVLSLVSSSCTPRPCPSSLPLEVEVGGQNYSLDHSGASHGGSFTVSCENATLLYGGTISVSCSLGTLTPDTSGCFPYAACPPSMSIGLAVGGRLRAVYPAATIIHGQTEVQVCNVSAPGYSGDVVLRCDDGALSVVSASCTPSSCPTSLTYPMSISSSSPPVVQNVQPEAFLAHGASEEQSCSKLGSQFTGNLTVTCSFGSLLVDCSCTGPCDLGYSGSASLTCNSGALLLASSDCTAIPCASSPLAEVILGAESARFGSIVGAVHGATWSRSCGIVSLSGRYVGTIALRCHVGLVVADASLCTRVDGCLPSTPGVPVLVGGMNDTLSATSVVAAGSTFQVPCGRVRPGFAGRIAVLCDENETLSADISDCGERPCPTTMTATASVGSLTGEVRAPAQLESGDNVSMACSEVSVGLQGSLNVMCFEGGLVMDMSGCSTCCLKSCAAPAVIAGAVTYVQTPVDIADSQGFWMPCASIRSGYGGAALLSCTADLLSIDTARCTPLPDGAAARGWPTCQRKV